MSYTYDYPRPAVTTDCVVFGLDLDRAELNVLLIQRDLAPFEGSWALPGGHVREHEDLEASARRELKEETGLERLYLEQLCTFGTPHRDPRGHYVTVAYYGLVNLADHEVRSTADARDAAWFPLTDLPPLAFDHAEILEVATVRLKGKVRYQPIGFELLPKAFALSQIQRLYEVILDRQLDKRNFRKKILGLDVLVDTGEIQKDVSHRAARLYRFDHERYQEKQMQGLNFEI
jgi:8-oxo-dGTP diphosphatase